MKFILVIGLLSFSQMVFAQAQGKGKAVKEVLPESVTTKSSNAEKPCDKKEDVLKKLEEKKKAEAALGKGLSLQGAKDTGCSI